MASTTTKTHSPTSIYNVADPKERLRIRAEGKLRSAQSSLDYKQKEVDRLRLLARGRAEKGDRSGQASANAYADQTAKQVRKLMVERSACQQELDMLIELLECHRFWTP